MVGKQKNPSGWGKGKWENRASLDNYRGKRNKKNKAQKEARKRNRK